MVQTQVRPACPNCGQADAVRPITEAYSGVVTGDAALPAPVQVAPLPVAAEIRAQLAPPVVPVQPQKSAFRAAKYRQTSPETVRSIGSKIDMGLLIGWLVLTFIVYLLVSRIDDDLVEILGTAIALVLAVLVYGFRQGVLKNLPIAGLREYYRRDAQEDAEAEQRAEQAYQTALANYAQAQSRAEKWRTLLYCARCNGVFDPQEHTVVPTPALQSRADPAPPDQGP